MIWLPQMRRCSRRSGSWRPALAGLPACREDAPKAQKAPEHKTTQSKSYIMVDPIYTTIVADNRAGRHADGGRGPGRARRGAAR